MSDPSSPIAGIITVYFRYSATKEEIEKFVESLGLTINRKFLRRTNGYYINVPPGKEEESAAMLKNYVDFVTNAHARYAQPTIYFPN